MFGSLGRSVTQAGQRIDQALNHDVLRIGVTGVSRAGKTVFIVSAIQNLLAMSRGDSLPSLTRRLTDAKGSRLMAVELEPPGVQEIPWFDVRERARLLGGADPAWPERTDDLSKLSVRLTLRRPSGLGNLAGGTRRVILEFLDYPGEWLLDLPLLNEDFASWSRDTLSLLRQAPRAGPMQPFLDFIAARPAWAKADEETARRGFAIYRDGLMRCRDELGLRWLQPGRFLRPGPFGESPLMWFFPFDAGTGSVRADTLPALLAQRFEAYKADMRKRFVEPFFSRFDRQVVLVDVLGALRAGAEAAHDTQRAVEQVSRALRGLYGSSWRPGRPFKRVVFVATKADHVPEERRGALRDLLMRLCVGAEASVSRVSSAVDFRVAASINCTRSGRHTVAASGDRVVADRDLPVVIGIPLGEDHERPWYCGEVPSDLPSRESDFWSKPLLHLPTFRPPAFDALAREGIPHLGLDDLLAELIGDAL